MAGFIFGTFFGGIVAIMIMALLMGVMTMSKYIFPCLLIALDFGAAIMYGIGGDFKKSYLLDSGGSIKHYSNILKTLRAGYKGV